MFQISKKQEMFTSKNILLIFAITITTKKNTKAEILSSRSSKAAQFGLDLTLTYQSPLKLKISPMVTQGLRNLHVNGSMSAFAFCFRVKSQYRTDVWQKEKTGKSHNAVLFNLQDSI